MTPRIAAAADSTSQPAGERGFTVLEVMVALVITLFALDVLFGSVSHALRIARDTAAWSRAISRAESRMAAISNPDLELGDREGDDGQGYRWRTHVAFLGGVAAPRGAQPGRWARGTGLYALSVAISWPDGHGEQTFNLDSARLGPAPGFGP